MICSKCKVDKDEGEFTASELKRSPRCKVCRAEYAKQRNAKPEVKARNKECKKQYYADPEVKERMKERQKQYRADPEVKAREKEYDKQYRADPETQECIKERMKEYGKEYRAKPEVRECVNLRHKQRLATDPLFKTTHNLRSLIRYSLKRGGYTKRAKTIKILGADFETVQHHLGPVPTYEYHIDHICPVSQAQNEEESLKLCHYTNLRYLSAEENLQKSDKKTPEAEAMCRQLLGREWIG